MDSNLSSTHSFTKVNAQFSPSSEHRRGHLKNAIEYGQCNHVPVLFIAMFSTKMVNRVRFIMRLERS